MATSIRAQNGGGIVTPVTEMGLIDRIKEAGRVLTGTSSAWFGPMEPMPTMAPPDVAGRQFDYMTGVNRNITPRSGDNTAVSFAALRMLADGYDLLRLVIETRKDQISRMKWAITPKGEKPADARADEITAFLQSPDREHDWDTWIRALLEDMLVIDAATVYPRMTNGGQIYSLDIIDGATIKRVLNADGRTPIGDEIAYQQIIKGAVAGTFTRDEILYKPRNWRVNRIYGLSPVEQVIMTVNLALRRQSQQINYYTEGSIPEAIAAVPKEWTTDQIKQMQETFDALHSGNMAARSKLRFVPGPLDLMETKDKVLKDQFDDWLARIVCFAFSISPQQLIQQQNKATAESSAVQAAREGLAPAMTWVKSVMDSIIARYFGAADLQFTWQFDEDTSPLDSANITKIYVDSKVITKDEARKRIGLPPLTPEQAQELAAAPPPMLPMIGKAETIAKAEPPPKPLRPLSPIDRERASIVAAGKELGETIKAAQAKSLDEVLKALDDAGDDLEKIKEIADSVELAAMSGLDAKLIPIYEKMLSNSIDAAITQLGVEFESASMAKVNQEAVDWAKQRSAELVGKRVIDGQIVDNPNPAWSITETTRDGIRTTISNGIESGASTDRLAKELQDAYAFSDSRAEMIARTERAFADVAGNMIAYEESGVVVAKEWVTNGEECEICQENMDAGAIPFGDEFPSGEQAPPAHPNCICDVIPLIEKQ